MYDDVGSTIFYTVVGGYGPCTTPMHSGPNPIAPTKKFSSSSIPTVGVGNVKSYKAVAYKVGWTDSAFTDCVVVDNTQN